MTLSEKRVDLEAVRARANAATAGPWESRQDLPYTIEGSLIFSGRFEKNRTICWFKNDWPETQRNRDFIEHARTDVPALCDELEATRRELDEARRAEAADYQYEHEYKRLLAGKTRLLGELAQAEGQAADNYREWGLCQHALALADAENKRLAAQLAAAEARAAQMQRLKARADKAFGDEGIKVLALEFKNSRLAVQVEGLKGALYGALQMHHFNRECHCPECDHIRAALSTPPAAPDHVQRQYERLIGPLRRTARENGYALAVHGSLKRDIDLVAVAWTEEAAAPKVLVDALVETARIVTGEAFFTRDPQGPDDFPRKPHGRVAWAISIGGGSYIDLSVIGPQAAPDPRDASARATLERIPVLNDAVITEAMAALEEEETALDPNDTLVRAEREKGVPPYSSNIAAVMPLAGKYGLSLLRYKDDECDGWMAGKFRGFTSERHGFLSIDGDLEPYAFAATPALAISLALKCLGAANEDGI